MKAILARIKAFFSHEHLIAHRAGLTLLAINFGVYFISLFVPSLMEDLALKAADFGNPSFLLELVTQCFAHAGFRHLLGNMLFVAPFAIYLERRVGSLNFFKYYLITGVVAGAVFVFTPTIFPWQMSLGASGACMGIAIAALAKIDEHPVLRALAIGLLACLLYPEYAMTVVGFVFSDGVAHSAHLGGAIAGLILAASDKT